MTKFIKVSDLLSTKGLEASLKINRTSSENKYDILQLQTKGNLTYKKNSGVKCLDDVHKDKILNFFEIARSERSALVVTPECSVPFGIIMDVIMDKDKWPEIFNLWCLCSEGMETTEFISNVKELKELGNIELFIEDEMTYSKHVNSLWYLFRINANKLCIIVQLKQRPMGDRDAEHEGDDLSQGNTVYIFDLNGNKTTKNVLMTLICADAIQLSSSSIMTPLEETYPIIINSQLNEAPFSARFIRFRNSFFFDTNISKQRLITVNWAKGTNIDGNKKILESGSVYYNYTGVNGKNHIEAISKDAELFKHRSKCQAKGISYFFDGDYNIWKIGDEEQCIKYFIKKGEAFGFNEGLGIQFEPEVKEGYCFNNESLTWNISNKSRCSIIKDEGIFKNLPLSNDNYLPMNYSTCIDEECGDECALLYNDYFFGICFGGFLREEINSNHEVSNRMLLGLNRESMVYTNKKRGLFKELIRLLENNAFPNSLMMYKNNHKFDIDYNCALNGSNRIYNVIIKESNHEHTNWIDKKAIFTILDTYDVSEVEKVYDKLYKATCEEFQDQIVIYYRDETGFRYFNEPHSNKSFGPSNSDFTYKTASIMGGVIEYEQS